VRCPWPSDRKGSHRVKDCRRPIKLDKGTGSFPKAKEYQKMKVAGIEFPNDDSEISESESSNSESSEEEYLDKSQEEYLDESEEESKQEPQEE